MQIDGVEPFAQTPRPEKQAPEENPGNTRPVDEQEAPLEKPIPDDTGRNVDTWARSSRRG